MVSAFEGLIYKYDFPVGFPPGITSSREELSLEGIARGRQNLSRGSYSWWKPHRDVISVFIIPNKYKTQKGEKLQTPEILDKYSLSDLLKYFKR